MRQGGVPPSDVGGFKKGDRVQWSGSDDDIPEGTVGTVVGFKDECVRVEFPKVTGCLPSDDVGARLAQWKWAWLASEVNACMMPSV